jgi:biopolymer transport protein ExbD
MAFSLNGGGYGSRRRAGGSSLSEINVTPFVDVVLVLLIIFMLTAHVMEFGIEVDVPKVRTVKDTAQEMPVVTITKDGVTTLNGVDVNINDLNDAIHQKFASAKAVYLRADKDAVWNVAVQVMAELGEGKFGINVVTQPEDTADKRRK